MCKIYRYSPIKTKEDLVNAIGYVATKTTELCQKVTGETYPITSLTIFSHYPDEFESLKALAATLGPQISENNGPFFKLTNPIQLPNSQLVQLRVRKPDPYRLQVGCNDFEVIDYQAFKSKYLQSCSNNLRLFERPEYEMIEFFDPDFDVLAYVVSG